jgi:hypothetical protein
MLEGVKNAIIHTHQNLLYFLEISTLISSGGNELKDLANKMNIMKVNIETALFSL